MRLAGDLLLSPLYVPYINMLAGLANGPRSAYQCFILLRGNGVAAAGWYRHCSCTGLKLYVLVSVTDCVMYLVCYKRGLLWGSVIFVLIYFLVLVFQLFFSFSFVLSFPLFLFSFSFSFASKYKQPKNIKPADEDVLMIYLNTVHR